MTEILFATPLLLLYAVLFGCTMKIADLLNEHGLKSFRGSKLVFGAAWGIFGALMAVGNNFLAIFVVAMVIHWVLRYRADCLSHGIAGAIILITFLFNLPNFTMDWLLFAVVFITYSVHGLLNDAADRKEIRGFWARYFGSNSHYFTVPIILTIINPAYWIVLAVSILHILSYETTKHYGMKYIEK